MKYMEHFKAWYTPTINLHFTVKWQFHVTLHRYMIHALKVHRFFLIYEHEGFMWGVPRNQYGYQ